MKALKPIVLLILLSLTVLFVLPMYETKDTTPRRLRFGLLGESKPTLTPPAEQDLASPDTPTPTPRPLTMAEMNAFYGPCVYLPVLMYHHIQDMEIAQKNNYANLTVATVTFRAQMEYLKSRGYTAIRPSQLADFFDTGTPIPGKSVLLTFDDGYEDFDSVASPILREFGFTGTVFIPTGLIDNGSYLGWGKISELSGSFTFANHTWSHKNMNADASSDEQEITTADGQLAAHGVNGEKVFAYPYGFPNNTAIQILQKLGYRLAFTTNPGAIQCKKNRFTLSRTRIGGGALAGYGL